MRIKPTCNFNFQLSTTDLNVQLKLLYYKTVTEETSILYAKIKLHNPSHEIVTTPTDPSETGPQPIRFTNKGDLNKAEIEFHAKFVASGTPPPLDPEHFVTYFTYGIIYGQMKLEYVIG